MTWIDIFLLALFIGSWLIARYTWRQYEAEVKSHAKTVENYHECATERNKYRGMTDAYKSNCRCGLTVKVAGENDDEWPDEITA